MKALQIQQMLSDQMETAWQIHLKIINKITTDHSPIPIPEHRLRLYRNLYEGGFLDGAKAAFLMNEKSNANHL